MHSLGGRCRATLLAEPRCLVVGAYARDLLLHHVHGFDIERATSDVDFAVAVADWGQFFAARASLLASRLFSPDREPDATIAVCRHQDAGVSSAFLMVDESRR